MALGPGFRPIFIHSILHLGFGTKNSNPSNDLLIISPDPRQELNRRIGSDAMTFGKLKCMAFTSKKVSLRVKNNVYSAMVLLFVAETLHNSWLQCITRDTVGRPDSISTKDLMEKNSSTTY